ncbi:MAG: cyclic nucleotide-binding domain-containing protein [Devosia sp.]
MAESWLRHEFLAPGMVLLAQGGRSRELYVLQDGQLDVTRDGVHVTVVKTAGAVFGEMSLLLDLPHTATVTAITSVEYFVIENALDVLRTHPELLLQIARLLAQRVNTTTELLTRDRAEEALVLPRRVMTGWGDPAI